MLAVFAAAVRVIVVRRVVLSLQRVSWRAWSMAIQSNGQHGGRKGRYHAVAAHNRCARRGWRCRADRVSTSPRHRPSAVRRRQTIHRKPTQGRAARRVRPTAGVNPGQSEQRQSDWSKKAAARRAISSAGTLSMRWLSIHCCPNGSRSRPLAVELIRQRVHHLGASRQRRCHAASTSSQ